MARPIVKETDRGYKAIMARFAQLSTNGISTAVGVIGDKGAAIHTGSDLTVAAIAQIHEYGAADDAHPPQRSFLRATVINNQASYFKQLKDAATLATSPTSEGDKAIHAKMYQLGERVRGDVIRRIDAGIPPGLAEATLERKREGGTTPLIDTGQLKNSIDFEVRRQKGGKT